MSKWGPYGSLIVEGEENQFKMVEGVKEECLDVAMAGHKKEH